MTAFLHENVLNFIEDGAVEDAAACLEQLSAADAMESGRRWGSEHTAAAGAATTAAAATCSAAAPPAAGCVADACSATALSAFVC